MTDVHQPLPPIKKPWEKCRGQIPDWQRGTLGVQEEENFYQLKDMTGNIHVCQGFFNKWQRCKKANPISYDSTMVCRKFHEDYLECYYVEKKVPLPFSPPKSHTPPTTRCIVGARREGQRSLERIRAKKSFGNASSKNSNIFSNLYAVTCRNVKQE